MTPRAFIGLFLTCTLAFSAAPGDYDGDGTTDMAVYHQAEGDWYIVYSGGGEALMGYNLGWSEACPVSLDMRQGN